METLVQLGVAAVLVSAGWLTGAYESALQEFSRSKLEDLLADHNRQKDWILTRIVNDPQIFRVTAAFVSALLHGAFLILGSFYWVLPLLPRQNPAIDGHSSWILAAAGLLLGMSVLRAFSEATGELLAEKLVLRMAVPAWLLTWPFRGLCSVALSLYRLLARGAGLHIEKTQEDLEDEVIAAVNDGELAGIVNEEQRDMIERVFGFVRTDVADIFTPRTDMCSLAAHTDIAEALKLALEWGHSRLPVYENTRDNIIGIFYVRDALQYWQVEQVPPLREIVRKPLYVPETKNVVELLQQMQRSHTQFAIVLDEYGGTAGLVTIEDVLEEIVGDIQDEFDNEEGESLLKITDSDHILADGHIHVSDINKALEDNLIPEDDDYETIGGFVLDNLGHIPRAGEEFNYNQLHVKVVSADERRVQRVEIIRVLDGASLN